MRELNIHVINDTTKQGTKITLKHIREQFMKVSNIYVRNVTTKVLKKLVIKIHYLRVSNIHAMNVTSTFEYSI